MTTAMEWVSAAGSLWSYFIVVPVVAGVFLWRGHRKLALATVLVTAGNLLDPLIKDIVRRPRPETSALGGYSFPSGHALGAMVFYGFLAYVAWRSGRKWVAGVLGASILLIGISRVVVGDHYVSDVVGGYVIGIAWLMFYIPAWKRL